VFGRVRPRPAHPGPAALRELLAELVHERVELAVTSGGLGGPVGTVDCDQMIASAPALEGRCSIDAGGAERALDVDVVEVEIA